MRGGGEGAREEGGGDLVSVETLLLPLSCVVFLIVKGGGERKRSSAGKEASAGSLQI